MRDDIPFIMTPEQFELGGLRVEVDRLKRQLEDANNLIAGLQEVHAVPGSFEAKFQGLGCEAFGQMLAQFFVLAGGTNFVEFQFSDLETNEFVVTCQKKTGKTPSQLLAEAKAENQRLETEMSMIARAVRWLLGYEGDFIPHQTFRGVIPKYWWRSTFLSLLPMRFHQAMSARA